MAIRDEVRTAVVRRLQRLARLERTVLMRAAVVGRAFDVHVVAAAASYSPSRVRSALEHARREQLIVADGLDRYSFRHALTHDIVYAETVEARLRPLHRRIARALEERARRGEGVLEELAYHAWAARDAARALRYNELAGDDAVAVHALEDARGYYRRARSLLDVDTASYARITRKLLAAEREE